ncbi:MAG: putative response regulator [Caulobacteraceae bacterium]|nr:putative response regulator [Caulobacteraceae bacterium]
MLSNCRVLIAEDEALVAADLAYAVEDAHGEVVGPFATVKAGISYLADREVHAAILDVNLADRTVTPMAMILFHRGKVVVFHTASGLPGELAEFFGHRHVCPKPSLPQHVVLHLARALGRAT